MDMTIHDVTKIRLSEIEDNLGKTKVRKFYVETQEHGTFELTMFGEGADKLQLMVTKEETV